MTAQPPPSSDRRDPLGFDELLALLIAFATIGAVLWWSVGRKGENWLSQHFSTPASPGEVSPTTVATGTPTVTPSVTSSVTPTGSSPLPAGSVEVSPTVAESGTVPGAVAVPGATTPGVVPVPVPVSSNPSPVPPTSTSPQPPIVVPSASSEAAVNFSDLPTTYWAYPFIAELSKRGMITGFQDGSFRPEQPVTRAEYATLISKVLPSAQQAQIPFSDVPPEFWGAPAIDEAVKTGFLRGYPDATFQPRQPITKLQVLLSLANGFQLAKPADVDAPLQGFDDRQQIPVWAKPAIAAATQSGVVVDYPNVSQLNPNQPVTRGEVAAMLYQALTTTGQVQPLQSNYIVRP
jgi:hypothetical protein